MNREKRKKEVEQAFLDAYVRLVRRERTGKVTVASLCREADLSRGTFYLHYQDIPAFFSAIEKQVTNEIIAIRQEYQFDSNFLPILENLFSYIQENADIVFTVLDQDGGKIFSMLSQIAYERGVPAWTKKSELSLEQLQLIWVYSATGAWAMLRQWWLSGYAVDKQTAKSICDGVVKHGIYHFMSPS